MSLDALRTALALQRPDPSWGRTHKAVLECLGDHANAAGESFVCVATICDEKWIDRKAVMKAIGDLRDAGWIVDTGKRRGRTGQVIVWEMPWIEHRNKEARNRDTYRDTATAGHTRPPTGEQPQGIQGVVEPAHKGEKVKGAESGTVTERVPVSDSKGPGLTGKGSRNRDTEPSTRLNPLPRVNPLAEGGGCAQARPPAREDRKNETPAGKASPKPKGKRMVPANWQPAEQLRADLAERFPTVAMGDELERFRDYSRANDKRFKDFDAAFRNWIKRAAEFARRDGKGGPASGRRYLD